MIRNLILLLFFTTMVAFAQKVKHIDPPFWWAGMNHQELQLMIYGDDVSELKPEIFYPGVKVNKVVKSDNSNYLWLYLGLTEKVNPGVMTILLSDGKSDIEISYVLEERKSYQPQKITSSDAVYLITPDRFANGDVTNDEVDRYLEGVSRDQHYGRHGGDIQGMISKLDYIKEMGFTAIWPQPLLQNNQKQFSYHGYSITDFYDIDGRFGGTSEYVKFVDECHNRGLKVIQDVVFNQIGDNHWWMSNIPAKDWLHIWPEYTNSNFKGETIPDPNASEWDRNRMIKGWFDPRMPDMNQHNHDLAEYLIQHTIFWIEYARLDGIRLDTYQYNYKDFMNKWVKRVYKEYPGFFIVGEVWMNKPSIISYWKKGTDFHDGFKSELEFITDFPVQHAIQEVYGNGKSINKFYEVISQDFLYTNANTNLIFADNHDVTRLYTLVGKDLNKFKQVIAFILTTRGIPQIYYGTEILMEGVHHGELRADYPGGWDGDKRDAFTEDGRTELENDAWNYLTTLLNWRKDKEVIHTGKLIHFAPHKEVYAYFRENEDDCVLVVINNGKEDMPLGGPLTERLKKYKSAKEIGTGKVYNNTTKLHVKAGGVVVFDLD